MSFLKRRTHHVLTLIHVHVYKRHFRKGLMFCIVVCGVAHFVYPEIEGLITIVLNVAFFYDPIISEVEEVA